MTIRGISKSPTITIEYDLDARAAYIRLKKGRVSKTIERSENFLLDIGKTGELLGVEILNPHLVSVKNCKAMFAEMGRKYKNSRVRGFHPEFVPQVFAA